MRPDPNYLPDPWIKPKQKDKYRRKGKGRRCCLGAELFQVFVALAIYFELGRIEEKDELQKDDLKKRINSYYSRPSANS